VGFPQQAASDRQILLMLRPPSGVPSFDAIAGGPGGRWWPGFGGRCGFARRRQRCSGSGGPFREGDDKPVPSLTPGVDTTSGEAFPVIKG
jgi:hypothetical protein